LTLIRRHCLGDRFVEATVERLELVCADQNVHLISQLRDALTDASVVLDELAYGQSNPQHLHTVTVSTLGNAVVVYCLTIPFGSQGGDQLIQKKRKTMGQLARTRGWNLARGKLRARTRENVGPPGEEEFVEHGWKCLG
jgi:hypothetical protein